jgi:DNA (cytosine-5)-methyltransferase 1
MEKIDCDPNLDRIDPPVEHQRTFYEFFAGGGMARLGLGEGWRCLLANDLDPSKARAYRENWGGDELLIEDVRKLSSRDLPGAPDLVWASFPCQDLSLAGKYAGIGAEGGERQTRSGAFWPFWKLVSTLAAENRKPTLVVLENVYGVLTSRRGADFAAIGSALASAGYRFGALVLDAKLFVPQSRPRVFIVGVDADLAIDADLIDSTAAQPWRAPALQSAYEQLKGSVKERWVWWRLPAPPPRSERFADIIEENPEGVEWHSAAQTARLLAMMSSLNLEKVQEAKRSGRRLVGGLYRRTRLDEQGGKVQRAEVRFDNVAGCLRTPSGGSSRQMILVVEKNRVRSRLLAPREAARLMGLPDSYRLPRNYNEAYHLCGDGVVAPVVRHLAAQLLEPLLDAGRSRSSLALKVA